MPITSISDFKPQLFGFVLINGKKVGSCVPFKFNNEAYIITCGHVLFGINQDENPFETGIVQVETDLCSYIKSTLITDRDFSKQYDLALVKLDVDSVEHFLELEFSSISVNPLLVQNFHLVTKHFTDKYLANISPLKIEATSKTAEHQYLLTFEKQLFFRYSIGAYGVDAFKGISGSGLFYYSEGQLALSGIIRSLEGSIEGHSIFVDANLISNILTEINLFDINQLDEDRIVISQILSECLDKTHDDSIINWIKAHSTESNNIVRKMQALHSKDAVSENVNKAVSNLLDGDRIVKSWEENNPYLYEQYKKTTYVTRGLDIDYTVESKAKAQSEYRDLFKQHKEILIDSFSMIRGRKVPLYESILVANRDLSQWLAICDLNFTIEQ